MGDIVNLKEFRKARTRAEAEARAAENRVRFGRTKGERRRQAQEDSRAQRELDQAKIERTEPRDGRSPAPHGDQPIDGKT